MINCPAVAALVALLDDLGELLLVVFVSTVAVLGDEVVHGEVAATHSDHDLVLVEFDKHPLPMVPVNSLALPLEREL